MCVLFGLVKRRQSAHSVSAGDGSTTDWFHRTGTNFRTEYEEHEKLRDSAATCAKKTPLTLAQSFCHKKVTDGETQKNVSTVAWEDMVPI